MSQFVCLWISGSSVKGLTDTGGTEGEGQEVTGGDEEEAEAGHDTPKQTTGKTSAPEEFTVLGGFENKPVQKVHRFVCGPKGRGQGSPVSLVFILWGRLMSTMCSAVHRYTESCLSGSPSPM